MKPSCVLLPALTLALTGLTLLGACSSKPTVTEAQRFTHADHLGAEATRMNGDVPLACVDCHPRSDAATWVTARPGKAEHAPCDTCHADAFRAPPGPLCATCHSDVDPRREGHGPLVPYPPRTARWSLGGGFSHAKHLGPAVRLEGRALDCEDCHRVAGADAAFATLPVHDDCARCHAPDGPAASAARMDDCRQCHASEGPGRLRAYEQNDVRFTHGRHRIDQSGAEIPCSRCHGAIPDSAAGDIALPAMATCATCHEDPKRTPDRVRIAQCGICHVGDVQSQPLPGNHTAAVMPSPVNPGSLGHFALPGPLLAQVPVDDGTATDAVLRLGPPPPRLRDLMPDAFDATLGEGESAPPASSTSASATSTRPSSASHPAASASARPTSHAFGLDRDRTRSPEDHTPLFRRFHADAANASGALCHYCHEGITGTGRDGCQECHAVSRPSSHTLRFRTATHGRDAARDPRACATCHEADQCAACHAVAPPSHRPGFAYDHRRAAAANPRACLSCHAFESTCVDCHASGLGFAGSIR